MVSSDASAPMNQSKRNVESKSQPKKRPLNGCTSSDAFSPHPNGFISSHRTNTDFHDTSDSSAPGDGRRKRKKTRAFEVPGPTFVRKISTGALGVSGHGMKLSAIPNIMYAMDKRHAKAPEIEFLHRLLFNSAGTVLKRKSNIRAFSGFIFQSEKERGRVRDKLVRSHLNLLRRLAALLDIQIKDRREPKPSDSPPRHNDAEMELAAEAFLGSDSLALEEVQDDIRIVRADETATKEAKEASKRTPHITNGKLRDTNSSVRPDSGTPSATAGLDAVNVDPADSKTVRHISRQRREESARVGKEQTVRAILSFLEMPKIPEGRVNRAQREKERKRQKKAAEKAKAQKALQKKAEERKRQLLAKKKTRESDEDGDEDLEVEAKPWIILARERQEQETQYVGDSHAGSQIMTNGHT